MQKLFRNRLTLYWIFVFVLALGSFNLLLPEATHADEMKTAELSPALAGEAQSSDLACRICHEETDAEITFPSGETLPVQVDLDVLAHSAHGMQADGSACLYGLPFAAERLPGAP